MADHSHEHADDGAVHVHVHPPKFYAGILGILLFLTVLTVVTAEFLDIDKLLALGGEVEGVGAYNLGLALVIATTKATFVVLFFMHLKDDRRFNAVIFVSGLLFIGVFFVYTMNDTATRGQTGDAFNGVSIDPETGERAPGGIDGPIHGEVLEAGLPEPTAAEAAADPHAAPSTSTVEAPGAPDTDTAVDEAAEEAGPLDEPREEAAEAAAADELGDSPSNPGDEPAPEADAPAIEAPAPEADAPAAE